MSFLTHHRQGQSLAEVLVATAVTALLVLAAVALISPVLRNDRQVVKLATSGALGRELLDNVRIFSEANWHNVYDLATSSLTRYYLSTSTSQLATSTGNETVVVGSSTYTRYFYMDEVRRTASNDVTTSTVGSTVDPSTRMVTVVVFVQPQGPTTTLSQIITRFQNSVFIQSDWSGAVGGIVITNSTTNQYVNSSNINATTTPGSIILNTL